MDQDKVGVSAALRRLRKAERKGQVAAVLEQVARKELGTLPSLLRLGRLSLAEL